MNEKDEFPTQNYKREINAKRNVIEYSKTCLKRTCSKADTWLKRTKFLAPAVFWFS